MSIARNNPENDPLVILPHIDILRMIEFCKDKEDAITRDFYDWYLDENPKFFTKKGYLIIEGALPKQQRAALYFDFSDPEEVFFDLLNYGTSVSIADFYFYREDNLTMRNAKIEYGNINLTVARFYEYLIEGLCFQIAKPIEGKDNTGSVYRDYINTVRKTRSKILDAYKIKGVKDKLSKSIPNVFKKDGGLYFDDDPTMEKLVLSHWLQHLIYCIYALMYFSSKKQHEEIFTLPKQSIETEKGFAFYKYSGYVNLNAKIYTPLIPKDVNEPTRNYERHIEAWTVRGFYRRQHGKLVWVSPHVKGSGNIENRYYSTEKEKNLNLPFKTFAVERSINAEYKLIRKSLPQVFTNSYFAQRRYMLKTA